MGVTKTDFVRGMQCPKMLWLDRHKPELKEIPPEVREKLDQGNDYGDRMMGMFGPYIEVQEVFGIEHCQVDELFKIKKRKAQSMVDSQRKNCENQVKKYMDKDLLDADIKSGAALEPVFEMVEERFALRNDFDYSVFIDNFRRVCKSHNDQCMSSSAHSWVI